MPQIQQIDTFLSQIIWLTITFTVAWLVLRTLVLPQVASVLEERRERIRNDLDKAEQLKAEADEVREAYEKSLAESRAEAQKAIREAAEAAKADAQKEHEKLSARLEKNLDAAEKRIAKARDEALGNVRAVAAELAQEAAQHLVGIKVEKKKADAAVKAAEKERA